MEKEPILVILAAGMGSRYGGLKQIEPMGPAGEILLDYSLYDARLAGFRRVAFIINKKIDKAFRERVAPAVAAFDEVIYVHQELDDLPEGCRPPDGRTKPWGTGHAVWCCRQAIDAPFGVIYSDDFYGRGAFSAMYGHLRRAVDTDRFDWSMVGFRLRNTLSANGRVSRGICRVEDGLLAEITERTHIERRGGRIMYTEDGGASWTPLPEDSAASLSCWGFTPSVFGEMDEGMRRFWQTKQKADPLGAEYYLPTVVEDAIASGRARVRILSSPDRWYGVTYKEDRPLVRAELERMTLEGTYPSPLL